MTHTVSPVAPPPDTLAPTKAVAPNSQRMHPPSMHASLKTQCHISQLWEVQRSHTGRRCMQHGSRTP